MKKKYILIIASLLVIALIVACGQIFTVRHVSIVFLNKTALADEAGILEASGLNKQKNIFNLKETEIKEKVSAFFDDNSIVVTDIERIFPNEVVVYVKERIPVFCLKVYSAEGKQLYVPTDKDFQRGKIYEAQELSQNNYLLINVTGFEVYETFDVKECIYLRTMANALIDKNIEEEALPQLIETVSIDDDALTLTLRETKAKWVISQSNVKEDIYSTYDEYVALSYPDRFGAVID